jgi:TatD DNase family protein
VGPDRPVTARPDPPEPLAGPTVDAHTHLDACGCVDAADVTAVLDRAAAVGVTRVVTVADDLASARWVVVAAHWDDRVAAAVALHPTRTAAVSSTQLDEVERLARDPRVVAVGETGLDYYWDYSPPAAQQAAFRWHIDLAKRLGKPLMIHDRDAHADVLRILDEEGAPETVVFHCFSGGAAMARTCVDAGYVLSFAGPVTFRNATDLRAAAALVPDDRLLVETDAPFLTPHPHRGRANEPYCLPWTVRGLATVRGVSAERVAAGARRTAEAVFGFAGLPPAAAGSSSGAAESRST